MAESIVIGIVGTSFPRPLFSPEDKKAVVVVAKKCALCLLNYLTVGISIQFVNYQNVLYMK